MHGMTAAFDFIVNTLRERLLGWDPTAFRFSLVPIGPSKVSDFAVQLFMKSKLLFCNQCNGRQAGGPLLTCAKGCCWWVEAVAAMIFLRGVGVLAA